MRIAILEDEAVFQDRLKECINEWSRLYAHQTDVTCYVYAEQLLAEYTCTGYFDLLLLDIRLPGMSGMTAAERIRQLDSEVAIVFISGAGEFLSQGYDVHALHFLSKPTDPYKLFSCLQYVLQKKADQQNNTFIIRSGQETLTISLLNVMYFTSKDHYITICLTDDQLFFRYELERLEEELPSPRFCRCHRKLLVHMKYVYSVSGNDVKLRNEQRLPIGRRRHQSVCDAFLAYQGRV